MRGRELLLLLNLAARRFAEHLCQGLTKSDLACSVAFAMPPVCLVEHVRRVPLTKTLGDLTADNRVGVDAGLSPLRDAVRAEPLLFDSLICFR